MIPEFHQNPGSEFQMAEMRNIGNFSRHLTDAEVKGLKLHPGDAAGAGDEH